LYNLQLSLCDFATMVEADQSMRTGDIGQRMAMWMKWAILVQGIKKLLAYTIHTLVWGVVAQGLKPTLVTHVHSIQVTDPCHDDHWITKDFYLEAQNYWIKYLYKNSGTNLDRLLESFSLNIPL
ncbi:hypothetical protein CROQUDRAFT_19689, partial [Cronartium quercuum f. sp. fusiforme G11]